jgi:hypothetical protein
MIKIFRHSFQNSNSPNDNLINLTIIVVLIIIKVILIIMKEITIATKIVLNDVLIINIQMKISI